MSFLCFNNEVGARPRFVAIQKRTFSHPTIFVPRNRRFALEMQTCGYIRKRCWPQPVQPGNGWSVSCAMSLMRQGWVVEAGAPGAASWRQLCTPVFADQCSLGLFTVAETGASVPSLWCIRRDPVVQPKFSNSLFCLLSFFFFFFGIWLIFCYSEDYALKVECWGISGMLNCFRWTKFWGIEWLLLSINSPVCVPRNWGGSV